MNPNDSKRSTRKADQFNDLNLGSSRIPKTPKYELDKDMKSGLMQSAYPQPTHAPTPEPFDLSGLDPVGFPLSLSKAGFHDEAIKAIVRAVNSHQAYQNFFEAVMGCIKSGTLKGQAVDSEYIKRQAEFIAKVEGRANDYLRLQSSLPPPRRRAGASKSIKKP